MQSAAQFTHFPKHATSLDMAAPIEHCQSRRIVATVLEAFQPLEKYWRHVALCYSTDNSTHFATLSSYCYSSNWPLLITCFNMPLVMRCSRILFSDNLQWFGVISSIMD